MVENTKIQWASHTFNPWIGCSKVHTGCTNCYAEALAGRLSVVWGPNGTRRRTADSTWRQVEKWNRQAAPGICTCPGGIARPYTSHNWPCPAVVDRPRVFPSLCDIFEDWQGPIVGSNGDRLYVCTEGQYEGNVGDFPSGRPATMADIRRDFFALVDRCQNLDFLLLTKRPENVRRMWPIDRLHDVSDPMIELRNVWLLYSASDQASLESGLPHLLACRDLVPVLGLSLEPLVGPVDLSSWLGAKATIGWVVVGGESGPRARPCNVEWIRLVVEQCKAAAVPLFVKQLGSHVFTTGEVWLADQKSDRRAFLVDRKGGNPDEWLWDLRVRSFPEASAT